MIFIKIDEQIKYALNEVKTYPKGYEFYVEEVLSISKCIGAGNWKSFIAKLYPALMYECIALGGNKFRKK